MQPDPASPTSTATSPATGTPTPAPATERGSLLARWRSRLRPRLLWDVFMVYLAVINVGLILFDLTYLWMRPLYFRYTPVVAEVYDPVKGIEPHPLTERLLEQAAELDALLERAPSPLPEDAAALPAPLDSELPAHLDALSRTTTRVLTENPFERSGQTAELRILERHLVESLGLAPATAARLGPATLAQRFWSWAPAELPDRLALFQRELRPLLEVNFYREYGLDGRLEDHFWLLDLPFLLIFATEFFARWGLALWRRTHSRWYLFPLLHWYDLLGIVPSTQFRVFRLFRIASIYVRLRRSEAISIGDDLVSRGVERFADVISEEITDLVALRILELAQQEIRAGALSRITRSTLLPRRDEVRGQIVERISEVLADPDLHQRTGSFLRANLDRAVESSPALGRVPLPDAALRPLVRAVGEAVYDSVVHTLTATLRSDEGRAALDALVDEVMDSFAGELGRGEVEALIEQTVIDLLEEMKGTVAEKRWTEAMAEARARAADGARGARPGSGE